MYNHFVALLIETRREIMAKRSRTAENPENSVHVVIDGINFSPYNPEVALSPTLLENCRRGHSLVKALGEINAWCDAWKEVAEKDRAYGRGFDKEVILLTKQWNEIVFDEYRDDFRYYALHEDFWFSFFLDTENGPQKIPFLREDLFRFTRHPVAWSAVKREFIIR